MVELTRQVILTARTMMFKHDPAKESKVIRWEDTRHLSINGSQQNYNIEVYGQKLRMRRSAFDDFELMIRLIEAIYASYTIDNYNREIRKILIEILNLHKNMNEQVEQVEQPIQLYECARRLCPPDHQPTDREKRLYVQPYLSPVPSFIFFDNRPDETTMHENGTSTTIIRYPVTLDMTKGYPDDLVAMLRDRVIHCQGMGQQHKPMIVNQIKRLLTKIIYIADDRAVKRHNYSWNHDERDLPLPDDYQHMLSQVSNAQPDDA